MISTDRDSFGSLLLFPTPLGREGENRSIPEYVIQRIHETRHFAVENLRNAVSFLQWIEHPVPEYELHFYELNKNTPELTLSEYLQIMLTGNDLGVLTDAGCPGIADPGSRLTALSHRYGIPVEPFTGPSSPLLALMAFGIGGQQFAFHGYLPSKTGQRESKLRMLEKRSAEEQSTQLFMETPFRNEDMFRSAMNVLKATTMFSVGAALTTGKEYIRTYSTGEWKQKKTPELNGLPAIFGIRAEAEMTAAQMKKRTPVKKKFGR